jgi:uncharacterized protein DUF5670
LPSAAKSAASTITQGRRHTRALEVDMFLGLAIVLLVIWILCVLVFKVTVAAIHLIVVIAVIAFIVHFVRGRATPTP